MSKQEIINAIQILNDILSNEQLLPGDKNKVRSKMMELINQL